MAASPGSAKCLNPRCTSNKKAANRGLCVNCYQSARRLVELKRTTWEELEKHGKAFASRRGNKGRVEWFLSPNDRSLLLLPAREPTAEGAENL